MSLIEFVPNADDAAIVSHVARVIAAGAPVRLALAGGATPAPILAALAASGLDMSQTEIWPTDERAVPTDHPASNGAALRRLFASTAAQIHDLLAGPAPGRFSLVWIGMGTDGHIASLFPRPPIAVEDPAAVIALTPEPLPPEAPHARITLNYAALLDADEIIVVARGAAKGALLQAAARGEGDWPIVRLARAARAPVRAYWRP
ncbi:MAG: 6-phosphogluconolactonase [Caulobacterales bacterium]|jgi:6-phosphogluconolactonase